MVGVFFVFKQKTAYERRMSDWSSDVCSSDLRMDELQATVPQGVTWFSPYDSSTFVPIPIAVIKNGTGPSVLLIAGNHGDEYEGQVLLTRLIRQARKSVV